MSLLEKIFRRRPRPRLDVTHPQVVALSKRLRALHAMPIGTKDEIEAWEAAAAPLRERLYEDCRDVYDSLPHEIEHYLVDVDIRVRDPGYARYQEDLLQELLSLPDENLTNHNGTTLVAGRLDAVYPLPKPRARSARVADLGRFRQNKRKIP